VRATFFPLPTTDALLGSYYGWEHYSSLRRVGGPYDGPANIELPDVLPEIPCRAGEESAKDNRDDNHLTFNEAQMMACSTSKYVLSSNKAQ